MVTGFQQPRLGHRGTRLNGLGTEIRCHFRHIRFIRNTVQQPLDACFGLITQVCILFQFFQNSFILQEQIAGMADGMLFVGQLFLCH